MSRISTCFDSLQQNGRKALIPYVTAGDPQPDVTVKLMHAMVNAGADILELGVPFSDPMAEGPVIQRAMERALEHHVSLRDVLGMVAEFRTADNETPVLLMGYLNPVEVMGYAEFARQASEAGVDGVLLVDLPPEEGDDFVAIARRFEIDPIHLVAPNTDGTRIDRIARAASGFIYYVSVKGITGAANLNAEAVAEKLAAIRTHTDLPVGVGFGIKDGVTAAQVAEVADAVIVGSALVRRIEALADTPEKIPVDLGTFLAELRVAIDEATGK